MAAIDLAVMAPDTPALVAALREASRGGRYAVADARLGGWTPHSVATQWLGQIIGQDVTLTNDAPPLASLMSLGDAMCAGIDEEGKGNRALLSAFSSARQLAKILGRRPHELILLTPPDGFSLLAETALLLGYLKELVKNVRVTMVATQPTSSQIECAGIDEGGGRAVARVIRARSLAAAIPTVISPRTAAMFDEAEKSDLLFFHNGWAVARPEGRRDDPWLFSQADIVRLGQIGLSSLRGFATYYSQPDACHAWQRCVEGWRLCHAGPRELAPLLMDQAVDSATTPGERDPLRAQRQALRIATSSYPAAAAESSPAPYTDKATASFIEESIGWGLVMTGQPIAAREALQRALALCSADPPGRAELLLMNIAALAELRAGDPSGAMMLEKRIEQRLAEIPDAEELRFVNSINQARLYRYQRDFDQAETYYERAFATTQGGRTETDHVNVELCRARLEMARGDEPAAFIHWVRAAIQWCSNDCPEALNWRVQMLVIDSKRRISVSSHTEAQLLVEDLAEGFLGQLRSLAATVGIAVDGDPRQALPFYASDAVSLRSPPRALGGAGWSVLAADVDERPRAWGPAFNALQAWLTAFIRRDVAPGIENCFLVDRRDGADMPTNLMTTLASAVDHGAAAINFDSWHVAINPVWASHAQLARSLVLNPFVAHVDGKTTAVRFRRYAPPFAPSSSQRELIAGARSGMILGEALAERDDLLAELAGLRRRRVLCLGKLTEEDIQTFVATAEPSHAAPCSTRGGTDELPKE